MATLVTKQDKLNGGIKAWAVTSVSTSGKRARSYIPLGNFATKRDAQREFNRIKDELNRSRVREIHQQQTQHRTSPTLAVAVPEYVASWRKSQGGLDRSKLSLRYIVKRLGHLKLTEVTPPVVEKYTAERLQDYSSNPNGPDGRRTCNLEINTLAEVMTWALKRGIISKHPFKDDAHPIASYHVQVKEKTPTVLTNNEIKLLAEALMDKPHGLTVLLGYLFTGMRKDELTQLTWDMIDINSGTIRFTTPKTGKPRVIPIAPHYQAILLRMKREWPGPKNWLERKPSQMKYVYCDSNGKPFTWNMGHFIPRLAKKLGLRNIHLHALRHTFATRLAPHVSGFELQQALGHSSIRMTQRYVNLGITDTMKLGLEKMTISIGLDSQMVDSRVDDSVLKLPAVQKPLNNGGVDGDRTRDLLRDRQAL